MLVKIGKKTYNSAVEPILLIFSSDEKSMIARMAPWAHRLCCYPPGTPKEKVQQFMTGEKA